jgi:uncharacterized membrane protein YhhN
MRKISHYAIRSGIILCLLAAIWSPVDGVQWVISALYLYLVGHYFGVTPRNEKVVGELIVRRDCTISDFLPMRKR